MFRGIKRNIFTAVLEILSIASVTLVLYLNLNLAGDVRLSLTEGARKTTGGYDLFLESPDGDAVSLSALSSLPQDSLLPYSSRLCMQGNIPGINYYACLFVDTEVITERGMVTVTEGRLPGNENEALILVTKTGNAALAPGNTVSVTEDDGTTHDLTICGVLSGFPLESNARPDVLELVIPRGDAPSAQRVYVDSHLAGTNRENLQDRFPDLRVNGLLDEADVKEEIEGFSRVAPHHRADRSVVRVFTGNDLRQSDGGAPGRLQYFPLRGCLPPAMGSTPVLGKRHLRPAWFALRYSFGGDRAGSDHFPLL